MTKLENKVETCSNILRKQNRQISEWTVLLVKRTFWEVLLMTIVKYSPVHCQVVLSDFLINDQIDCVLAIDIKTADHFNYQDRHC